MKIQASRNTYELDTNKIRKMSNTKYSSMLKPITHASKNII